MQEADDQTAHRLQLRDAVVADAAALAFLNAASWRAAYADVLPASYLAALEVDAWQERLRARIDAADAAQFTLVACEGGSRLGLVSGGPARSLPPSAEGEVYAIYVDPTCCGRGVGSALLGAAEARLTEAECSHAALWVFTRNATARRFYERRGWRLQPERRYWRRDGLCRQLVCYRKSFASG